MYMYVKYMKIYTVKMYKNTFYNCAFFVFITSAIVTREILEFCPNELPETIISTTVPRFQET